MGIGKIIDIISVLVMIYFSIRVVRSFIEGIRDSIRFKKVYKEMGQNQVLFNGKRGIKAKIIDIVIVAILIVSLFLLIKVQPNIILKVMFSIISALGLFVYVIYMTRKSVVTDKGIFQVAAFNIILELVLWQEIVNYSRMDKSVTIEYRRNNKEKKMLIQVINNEERNKVLNIIKNNI